MELTQALRRSALTRGDEIAIIDGQRRHSWRQVLDRVMRLAAGLRGLGVERGDRVAILAANSDRYYHLLHALFGLGAVAVPLNTRLALPELAFQIRDAGAKLLVAGEGFAEQAAALRAGPVEKLVAMDGGDGFDADVEGLIAASAPIDFVRCDNHDMAAIFYTGGTTGMPKGVMHSHGSLHAMAVNIVMQLKLDQDCVVLHSAPMFHLADFAIFVVTLVGGRHVIIPQFDDLTMLDAIETHGVTHSFTVPAMITRIARNPDLAQRDLSRLRVLGYGGAPMPWGDYLEARHNLPHIDFIQGFGLTEMPSVSFLMERYHRVDADPAKLRSAGVAGYGFELRIVDREGRELPHGEIGEIAGRGDNVMLGYWNRPEETRAALRDGWMHTGDAGYMDDEGLIYITDRFKDMIVSGGENIYSIEVENILSTHPAVAECAVIGMPDAKWGERVHAVLSLRPDAPFDADEAIAFCRQSLAGYKIPRTYSIHDGPLPRTAAGKIQKNLLRSRYQDSKGDSA